MTRTAEASPTATASLNSSDIVGNVLLLAVYVVPLRGDGFFLNGAFSSRTEVILSNSRSVVRYEPKTVVLHTPCVTSLSPLAAATTTKQPACFVEYRGSSIPCLSVYNCNPLSQVLHVRMLPPTPLSLSVRAGFHLPLTTVVAGSRLKAANRAVLLSLFFPHLLSPLRFSYFCL